MSLAKPERGQRQPEGVLSPQWCRVLEIPFFLAQCDQLQLTRTQIAKSGPRVKRGPIPGSPGRADLTITSGVVALVTTGATKPVGQGR
jgi:hypothetical protein